MVKPIVTPVPEVADRYTIALLKIERLGPDEIDIDDMRKQIDYYREGLKLEDPELAILVNDLYEINGKMWDAEYAIRKGQDENLGLEEIGRRALQIRDLNRIRMKVKNDIIELTGDGFKDCKMNYAE
tara:strand:- start:2448 stop:2828 length:381 start_codon:yes stop_codon:yes gene_type:complete